LKRLDNRKRANKLGVSEASAPRSGVNSLALGGIGLAESKIKECLDLGGRQRLLRIFVRVKPQLSKCGILSTVGRLFDDFHAALESDAYADSATDLSHSGTAAFLMRRQLNYGLAARPERRTKQANLLGEAAGGSVETNLPA
jgi:hypothetical protein